MFVDKVYRCLLRIYGTWVVHLYLLKMSDLSRVYPVPGGLFKGLIFEAKPKRAVGRRMMYGGISFFIYRLREIAVSPPPGISCQNNNTDNPFPGSTVPLLT